MKKVTYSIIISLAFLYACSSSKGIVRNDIGGKVSTWSKINLGEFETKLELLRQRHHIPGFSVGIVHQGNLTWKKGFGFKDIELLEKPDENTVYHTASITKTFGAMVMMQLVEEGKINLNDPIKSHGITLPGKWGDSDDIQIQHLLTHTARGNTFNGFKPGFTHRYNGSWYHLLGKAYLSASGKSFDELVMENIIIPLGMSNTAPSLHDSIAFAKTGIDSSLYAEKVAKPYDWAKKTIVPVDYHYNFGPAAGLMSTVSDLAKYSNAIDDRMFLNDNSWDSMLTPFITPKGKETIYGLGWFVDEYYGMKFIWHTGWWKGYSSLFLKVPELDLTFIILANSQDVSRPFYKFLFGNSLHKNLLASDFATTFIDHFVLRKEP
ncbi:serine hydrolase domain-containing protein [Roseivirga sp.]|uniref:serine hydrolase domain-containing protein n=1 Tax=Roseivirga sp. TaxID=1964215 RepID=UPI003B8BE47B